MTARDAVDVGKLAILMFLAWLLPARCWRRTAQATRSIGQADPCWPAYRHILKHRYSESEIAGISIRRRVYNREMKLQILGLNAPWHRWHADIRLNGVAHLREALSRGSGAILWVTESSFSTLIVKIALHRAGYRATQLSRPEHGFSTSRFGIRILNPLWTRVENRFIAERILIVGDNGSDALAKLRSRLADNRIVIITVVPHAHRFAEVPFRNAKLLLPTGPIRLARTTHASLLPVFAFARPDGAFEVSIEAPLRVSGDDVGDDCVAAAYAERLESFVLQCPDQWNGWHGLMAGMQYAGWRPPAEKD